MDKKCKYKVILSLIVLAAFFGFPGIANASMRETNTITLRQTDSGARAVTDDGAYIYIVVESSPTRVIKVRKSDMKEIAALTLDAGENIGFGITHDNENLYIVTNTSPAMVIKVQKDSMTKVGAVALGQNSASAVTHDGTYLYVVTNTIPTTVTRVQMSDLSVPDTNGTLTLTGHYNGRAVTIVGDYLYVVNYSTPTTVAKVKKSDLTIPVTNGTLALETGENNGVAVTNDSSYLYVVNYSLSNLASTVTKVQMSDMSRVSAVTLTGVIHAHSVTRDDTYLYIATLTSPIKLVKVRMSDMGIEGSSYTVNTGGARFSGASSITGDGTFLYMATYSASVADPINVIKLQKSDMTQIGILTLGEYSGSAVSDDDTYLYVINSTFPTTVTKVRKSDNTRVDALTLNAGENKGIAVTNDGEYLYVVNNTSPTTVTKVKMNDMTRVGAVTLGEYYGSTVTNDDTYLYVATNTAPTTVVKIKKSDLTIPDTNGTLTLNADEKSASAVTHDGTYLYVVNKTSPTIITKVKMDDMTRVGAFTLEKNDGSAIANDGTYLYVVTDTYPSTVTKIQKNELTILDNLILNTGENNGRAITHDGTYLYVVNYTSPTKVTKVRKADMVREGVLTLSTGVNIGRAITWDANNLYVVTNTSPTRVAWISCVTNIAIKTQPTKLTYTAGEELDLSGLEVTLTYNDGSTADITYTQFSANGITANPDQGTVMTVAGHNGQALTLNCNTHTATTANLTVNPIPTYDITLSETGTHIFNAQVAGYMPVAPVSVTVTRIGAGIITNLSAALGGANPSDFILEALDVTTLDSTTASAAFTIRPDNDLAPGTYSATVTVNADHGVSRSFSISFTVNAPAAPIIQSATARDKHVNITWNSVPEATGYKIYKSTVSNIYDEAPVTVSGSVYSYDVMDLSNGIPYFFVVRSSIGMYESENSNEVSATPQVPAPGAPALQTAAAGDGHVSLTWTGEEGSTAYNIYTSTTCGSYVSPAVTVAESVYNCDVTGLVNGTLYYFVVTASNPGGDSAYSNEISAMPQVSPPGAPTGVQATGGNEKVTLSWDCTAGAAGYKIYQNTASGSYGTALATVAGSVYGYEAVGLTNGMTYYFVIKAFNAGGDSPKSGEVSAMPRTVPGVPTNVAATAGNGLATVSFTPPVDNGGSSITEYRVTSSPGNFTATGAGSPITVTGLSNGIVYTFTVAASNAFGTGSASAASNAVTPYKPSNGGSDDSSTPSTPISPVQPANNGIDILVNGKTETAATATTTREGGKTVTTIVLDDKKVEERLKQEGNNAVVTIMNNNSADIVTGILNGQTIKSMENIDAVLEIKTGQVTYTLPASQINIDAISQQIGNQVDLKDITVSIKIAEPAPDMVRIVEDTANKNNYQIVVRPVEFEITCSSGNKTVEVTQFNAYVERLIALPDGVDPSRIITAVVLNSDGTFSHVPTAIVEIDGKYYAKINSLTNSIYSIIWNIKAFMDVENHWAKDIVNDMGSRLVIKGVDDDRFEPDRDITRAEFTAIVVRALGLMHPGTGKNSFKDVIKGDWYYDAVSIANEYGLLFGYGNGKCGPMDKITREQAMVIISRTMKMIGLNAELTEDETHSLFGIYTEAGMLPDYARNGISACIKAGIISGAYGKSLALRDNLTRAEAAVIVWRLLKRVTG